MDSRGVKQRESTVLHNDNDTYHTSGSVCSFLHPLIPPPRHLRTRRTHAATLLCRATRSPKRVARAARPAASLSLLLLQRGGGPGASMSSDPHGHPRRPPSSSPAGHPRPQLRCRDGRDPGGGLSAGANPARARGPTPAPGAPNARRFSGHGAPHAKLSSPPLCCNYMFQLFQTF